MKSFKLLFVFILCLVFLTACLPGAGPGPGPGPGPVPVPVPGPVIPEEPQHADDESVFGDFIIENVGYGVFEGKEYIFGDVTNTSTNNTYAWAEVEIVLADDDMDHIQYVHVNTDQLGPGMRWEFLVALPNVSFKYYYIRNVYGSIQEQLNKLNAKKDLAIVEHTVINNGTNYQVVGTVQNITQNRYAYVDILIHVFDEDKNIVEQLQPSTIDLGPSGIWNFEATITAQNASSYEIIEIYGY
ncbi:FxLYD domain-containing protein [Ureibacillus manganicus]|uniref:Uncharacterized protein n=1 Tax=Ureibacillus manganicus DSM 26584 TaxID=1384049 RepID=A0A0A3IYM8_9BACL|nr:FxLYD domain-containing protein [Ureibacillus manganicus]KGR79927.1 hypothetical protein CD29_02915 [Ureibacillus manganicus DSM 26584]